MTFPALIFSIIISTLYGAAFHLWRGGSAGRLLLYLILGWLGFFAGHLIANYFEWDFGKVGTIQAGFGTLGSFLLLSIGHWLSKMETRIR